MTDTITLPRSVVEQALEALEFSETSSHRPQYEVEVSASIALRAALEQPQVQSGGIPPNWKLVPVEPTKYMKAAGALAAMDQVRRSYNPPSVYIPVDSMALLSYRAMLAAAPQPPVVEQPQGEQEPVAWQRRMRTNWMQENQWWPWQECSKEVADDYKRAPVVNDWEYESRALYTHPQPPRQPLTCNSCKGLGRVYRGCNEWAACVHCNTTGIGGEK